MLQTLRKTPVVGPALAAARAALRRVTFPGSAKYWDARYRAGGNSGAGSTGRLAAFKAETIGRFVTDLGIRSVIEFGCGDGTQLALAEYPAYLGIDVSKAAITRCRTHFANEPRYRFQHADEYSGTHADLSLSLDVIYHLVEDAVYARYMETLFDAADRYVLIYAGDFECRSLDSFHVRTRRFGDWIAANRPEWRKTVEIPNRYPYRPGATDTSFCAFYLYGRRNSPAGSARCGGGESSPARR